MHALIFQEIFFFVRIANLLFHKLNNSPFVYFRFQGMFSENSKETSDPAEKYKKKNRRETNRTGKTKR